MMENSNWISYVRVNKQLEVVGCDAHLAKISKDKTAITLFIKRGATDYLHYTRWLISPKTDLFQGTLTLNSVDEERVVLNAFRMDEEILLVVKREELVESKYFLDNFWGTFSKTFKGDIILLDLEGCIIDLSLSATNLLSFKTDDNVQISKESLGGVNLFEYLTKHGLTEFSKTLKEHYDLAILEKERKETPPLLYGERHIVADLAPNYTKGQSIGSCLYLYDLTDTVLKEKKIEEQRVQLMQSAKLTSLGVMAGGIAHEINNPLQALLTSNSILGMLHKKEQLDDEKFNKIHEKMTNTIRRVTSIVKSLQTVSMDSSVEEPFQVLTLQDILSNVVDINTEKLKKEMIDLQVDLDNAFFKIPFLGQKVQLSQLFINLINNSRDAVSALEKKWIRIEGREIDNNLEICFSDSGTGIAEGVREQAFQPFFTTKEIGEATGLGLSISYSIVKRHNGELFIDSDYENTCFVITLPKKQPKIAEK